MIGTYHHISDCHLHRHTAEFDFRYNTRQITDAERAFRGLVGIALQALVQTAWG